MDEVYSSVVKLEGCEEVDGGPLGWGARKAGNAYDAFHAAWSEAHLTSEGNGPQGV